MDSPLRIAIKHALFKRANAGLYMTDLSFTTSSTSPDLFSNDYLSITTDPQVQRTLLEQLSKSSNILGTGGSRCLSGNFPSHVQFEDRMREDFNAHAALFCNSGYDANVALFSTLPQHGDAVICDELIHTSTRDGIAASRAKGSQYTFTHNSLVSLRSVLATVLQQHPNISEGRGTIFVAVESVYSMDGDFAPLLQIVSLVEKLVPKGCSHIVVDEAHSTGLFGEGGRGIVSMLGLSQRVDSVLHTFGKARGFSGAILLTSPLIKTYIASFAKPFMFTTSLPLMHMIALSALSDSIMSPLGQMRMDRLQYLCKFFYGLLTNAVKDFPKELLSLKLRELPEEFPIETYSPIFPILTCLPQCLASHLQALGYICQAVTYPAVAKGQERIRVSIHAGNTETELEDFIQTLVAWAHTNQKVKTDTTPKSVILAKL